MEYQYLLENLLLRQLVNKANGEATINVIGLKIRNRPQRFENDGAWISHLRATFEPEIFMLQKVKRWNGKNVVFTVYNAQY